MKIYKVTKSTSVRVGASRYANISHRVEADDKVFSEEEKNGFVKISWVEAPGYGNDPLGRGWINKDYLEYRGNL